MPRSRRLVPVGLCVLGAILWCVGMQQVWLFWESTRQWTMGFEWFQHPTWLPEGTHISNVGSNGPLPIYIYGLVFGLTHSEWALPLLTTSLYGFNAVWIYRWMHVRYRPELAALISLALVSNPILWQLVRAGIEFSFAIVLAPYLGYLLVYANAEPPRVARRDIAFGFLLIAVLQFEKTFAPVAPFVAIIYAWQRRSLVSLSPMIIWAAIFLLPALLVSHAPSYLSYSWDWAMFKRVAHLFAAQFLVLDTTVPWIVTAMAYGLALIFSLSLLTLVFRGKALQRWLLLAAMANLVALAYTPESNHHLLVYMISALIVLHALAVIGLTRRARLGWSVLALVCCSQLTIIGWASWSTYQRGAVILPNWYPLSSPATIEVPTVGYRQTRIQTKARSNDTPLDLLIDETGWLPIGSEALTSPVIGLVPDATWNAIRGLPLASNGPTELRDTTDELPLAIDPTGHLRSYEALRRDMYGRNKVMGLALLPYQIGLFPQTYYVRGAKYLVVRSANFPLEFYDAGAPKLALKGIGEPLQLVYSYFNRETWYPIDETEVTLSFNVDANILPYYLGMIQFVQGVDIDSNGL